MYSLAVLTISDKGYKGLREDLSGPIISRILRKNFELKAYKIVPDEEDVIAEEISKLADQDNISLIITTGGTGLSKRDVTPEATLSVVDRIIPGISEAIRIETLKYSRRAMLSRAVAGMRKHSLIINLPGSPKAVEESLQVFQEILPHAIEIIVGSSNDCAR